MTRTVVAVGWFALSLSGCGGDVRGGTPMFPENYRSTYTEVRNCRTSSDHSLHKVRVFADPEALAPYLNREAPFPEGSIVIKEEYEFDDVDCSGEIAEWTVMVRDSSSPQTLDWQWQSVDSYRSVTSENDETCYNCHSECGVEPDGYLGTCTVP